MSDEEILDSSTGWVAKHVKSYIESDGKQGQEFHGVQALLLTTRGRKSGKLRRTALYYGRHGDAFLVVASAGGQPEHPLWYLNVAAEPEVRVQVGAETFAARARTATAQEKPELWRQMVELFPTYAGYQTKTTREIPIVVLERVP